ncbi:MAG: ATP-binding protein, partial [Cyanobacteria bacterium P01_G01_bin.4]
MDLNRRRLHQRCSTIRVDAASIGVVGIPLSGQWLYPAHAVSRTDWTYAQFLLALCELEAQRRWTVRLQRSLKQAQLPTAKTLANFDWSHLPQFNPAPLMQLAEDTAWLERAENCLVFGPSGVGKTRPLTCPPKNLVVTYSSSD